MASPTPSSAIPAPSGQVSDFSGPNQLWQWNILSQVLCLGIPGIMFLMRVYVRYWIKREWILEDRRCSETLNVVPNLTSCLDMTVLSYVRSHKRVSSLPELMRLGVSGHIWRNIDRDNLSWRWGVGVGLASRTSP